MGRQSLFVGLGLAVATTGCMGGLGRSESSSSSGVGDPGGTLRLQLATIAGLDLEEVSYSIQAPDRDPLTGTVKITDENLASGIVVKDIPVSEGVTVALHASAADDIVCEGEGTVDVVAGETTPVAIVLQCRLPDGAPLPDGTGSINVQASVNICPQVLSVTAAEGEGSFSVSATARDPDGEALTYAWSAAVGAFVDVSAEATRYTCAESGDQTLTVAVSDAKGCTQTKDVVVTCTAAEPPPAEEPPAEEPPAEEPPAEQPPAEEPPAEQPPAEEPPAEEPPPAEGTELPCDVKAVLEEHCLGCHGDPLSGGAPMPLVTLADLRAEEEDEPGTFMYQNVKKRVLSETRPMPPKGLPGLSDEERATLVEWIDAGAPGSDGICEPSPT